MDKMDGYLTALYPSFDGSFTKYLSLCIHIMGTDDDGNDDDVDECNSKTNIIMDLDEWRGPLKRD